ncbi:MAG: hypothetical protein ABSE86_22705 [Bryobacteraceae bacterium]|jgi:hypothetical protein
MMRVLAAAVGLLVAVGLARAGEPIAGTWRLERQELNGEKGNFDPLTLRIAQSGDKLAFAFSVPINNIHYVSMTYTVRLDGTEADVKNGQGEKLGTIKLTKAGSRYKFILSGANRPQTSGTLTVSPDGKSLTCESDAVQGGRNVHLMQLFSRA